MRSLKLILFALLIPVALGGCTLLSGSSSTTSTLTLTQVQEQVAQIQAGVDAANILAQASTLLTAAEKTAASQADTSVDAAATVVAGLNASASVTQNLINFDNAAATALPALAAVFTVNPATAAAIELGLGLKDTFLANYTTSGLPADGVVAFHTTAEPWAPESVIHVPLPTRIP